MLVEIADADVHDAWSFLGGLRAHIDEEGADHCGEGKNEEDDVATFEFGSFGGFLMHRMNLLNILPSGWQIVQNGYLLNFMQSYFSGGPNKTF